MALETTLDTVAIGKSVLRRQGTSVAILSFGSILVPAMGPQSPPERVSKFLRSSDANQRFILKRIRRNIEVSRCRTLSDTSGRVVHRSMTGAEPPAISALRVARRLTKRDASKMRANADHDEPLRSHSALGVGRRVDERRACIIRLGARNFLGGAMDDEEGHFSPFDSHPLPELDGRQVHINRG